MIDNFVERNLSANDSIKAKAKFSMVAVIPSAIVVGICFLLYLVIMLTAKRYGAAKFGLGSLFFWILIAFIFVGIPYLKLKSMELAVTEMKVIGKTGFPFAKALDVYLERIDSFAVVNSFFGKLFGYSTIVLRSNTGFFRFPYVIDAVGFKHVVMTCYEQRDLARMDLQAELIAQHVNGTGGQASGAPSRQGRKPSEVDDQGTVSVGAIEVMSGEYKGAVMKLEKNETITMGRDEKKASLLFQNSKVSGLHLALSYTGSGYVITDHSSYGVYIQLPNGNRQKLTKGADTPLKKGTVVIFADSEVFRVK